MQGWGHGGQWVCWMGGTCRGQGERGGLELGTLCLLTTRGHETTRYQVDEVTLTHVHVVHCHRPVPLISAPCIVFSVLRPTEPPLPTSPLLRRMMLLFARCLLWQVSTALPQYDEHVFLRQTVHCTGKFIHHKDVC